MRENTSDLRFDIQECVDDEHSAANVLTWMSPKSFAASRLPINRSKPIVGLCEGMRLATGTIQVPIRRNPLLR
jgi:hypothetical protein